MNINLENLKSNLENFNKIIVTGPIRSGTTISGVIIAKELNIPFIDEMFYRNNFDYFFRIINSVSDKIVIHNVRGIRDIHKLFPYFDINNMAVILVKRNIDDILDSFENSKKYIKKGIYNTNGKIFGVNDKLIDFFYKHFEVKDRNKKLPEIVYEHFYANLNGFKNFFELEYECLKDHEMFVKKDIRRKKFTHLKQVSLDPLYLRKINERIVFE